MTKLITNIFSGLVILLLVSNSRATGINEDKRNNTSLGYKKSSYNDHEHKSRPQKIKQINRGDINLENKRHPKKVKQITRGDKANLSQEGKEALSVNNYSLRHSKSLEEMSSDQVLPTEQGEKSSSKLQNFKGEAGENSVKNNKPSNVNRTVFLTNLENSLKDKLSSFAKNNNLTSVNRELLTAKRPEILQGLRQTYDEYINKTKPTENIKVAAYKLFRVFTDKSFMLEEETEEKFTGHTVEDMSDDEQEIPEYLPDNKRLSALEQQINSEIKIPKGVRLPDSTNEVKSTKAAGKSNRSITVENVAVGRPLLAGTPEINTPKAKPQAVEHIVVENLSAGRELPVSVPNIETEKAKLLVNNEITADIVPEGRPLPSTTKEIETGRIKPEINGEVIIDTIPNGQLLAGVSKVVTPKNPTVLNLQVAHVTIPEGESLPNSTPEIKTAKAAGKSNPLIAVENVAGGRPLLTSTPEINTPKAKPLVNNGITADIVPEGRPLPSTTKEIETGKIKQEINGEVIISSIPNGQLLAGVSEVVTPKNSAALNLQVANVTIPKGESLPNSTPEIKTAKAAGKSNWSIEIENIAGGQPLLTSTPKINTPKAKPQAVEHIVVENLSAGRELQVSVPNIETEKAKLLVNNEITADIVPEGRPLPNTTKEIETGRIKPEINGDVIIASIPNGQLLAGVSKVVTPKNPAVLNLQVANVTIPKGESLPNSTPEIKTAKAAGKSNRSIAVENVAEGQPLLTSTPEIKISKTERPVNLHIAIADIPEGSSLPLTTSTVKTEISVLEINNTITPATIAKGQPLPDAVTQFVAPKKEAVYKLEVLKDPIPHGEPLPSTTKEIETGKIKQEINGEVIIAPITEDSREDVLIEQDKTDQVTTEYSQPLDVASLEPYIKTLSSKESSLDSSTKTIEYKDALIEQDKTDQATPEYPQPLIVNSLPEPYPLKPTNHNNTLAPIITYDNLDIILQTVTLRLGDLEILSGVAAGDDNIAKNVWIKGIGSYSKQKTKGNNIAFKNSQKGTILGVDIELKENIALAGIAYANVYSQTKLQDALNGNDRQKMHLHATTIYGEYALTPKIGFNSYLTYGKAFIKKAGNINGKTTGDVWRFHLKAFCRKNFINNLVVSPSLGITSDHFKINRLKTLYEQDIKIPKKHSNRTSLSIALNLKKSFQAKNFDILPEIYFNIDRILSKDKNTNVINVTEENIQTLVSTSIRSAKTTYNIGSAINIIRARRLEFNTGYSYSFRPKFNSHSGYGSLAIKF